MRNTRKSFIAVLAAASVGVAGCDDFLQVTDTGNLETDAIDLINDARTLAYSALQNFHVAYGEAAVYDAWFTNVARVGDTFPTRNEFGRREVADAGNAQLNGFWNVTQRAIASSEGIIRALDGKVEDINLARAYVVSGYAAIIMAEQFCEGTVAVGSLEAGPRMTTAQVLTHAIDRLTKANAIASKLTGTDATNIATGALVGIARAHLQAGRKAEARTFATQVPANFVWNATYIDDASNRTRLGNNVWNFSESRISLVVTPEFRAIADAGDPRVRYQDMNRLAQDGVHRFYRQMKFTGWASPIRIASGLEAQYIAAEAGTIDDQLALINARRSANGQTAFASASASEVLRELMEQRTRDFWLEAKRTGDFRRNGNSVPYILPTGEFYKPELGPVGTQTCLPVPVTEKNNNPNW